MLQLCSWISDEPNFLKFQSKRNLTKHLFSPPKIKTFWIATDTYSNKTWFMKADYHHMILIFGLFCSQITHHQEGFPLQACHQAARKAFSKHTRFIHQRIQCCKQSPQCGKLTGGRAETGWEARFWGSNEREAWDSTNQEETHGDMHSPSVHGTDSRIIKMFSRPFETKQRKTLFLWDNHRSGLDVAFLFFFNSYYHCNSSLATRRLQCEQFW